MIIEELFTQTLVNVILSGDVHQARLLADASPLTIESMSKANRLRISHACDKWGIPSIL